MSERSFYFLEQAEKCRWHASLIGDPETRGRLLKLADEYMQRAASKEAAESGAKES